MQADMTKVDADRAEFNAAACQYDKAGYDSFSCGYDDRRCGRGWAVGATVEYAYRAGWNLACNQAGGRPDWASGLD